MRSWKDDEELEGAARAAGALRYWKDIERRGEASSGPGMKLMGRALEPAAAAIREWIAAADKALESGGATRNLGVVRFIAAFEPELLALITLREVINAPRRETDPRVAVVAMRIAAVLNHMSEADRVKAEHPEFKRRMEVQMKKKGSEQYRFVVIRAYQKHLGMQRVLWGPKERARVGATLLELVAEATGLFRMGTVYRGVNESAQVVMLTQKTINWLAESHEACQFLRPLYLPTMNPPRPWTGTRAGGYYDLPSHLIKGASKAYLRDLDNTDLSGVFAAVNALQNTRWAINHGVLEVLRAVWESELVMGSIPPRGDRELPAKPWPEGTEPTEQQLDDWKKGCRPVYEERAKDKGRRLGLIRKLDLADEFGQLDGFYLPHQMDFRGRMYCMVSMLNPQEDDVSRGLLRFATGKALGDNGAYWLAVHGANLYGNNKVSFDERAQWVLDHEELILDSAMRPLEGERFWMQSDGGDTCWQFLAFCQEWAGYVISGRSELYQSRLPVSVDGSCNGLQNFSAMLRDEVGGAAVNLVPADKPQDIYAEVAKVVARQVEADAAGGNPDAARWVGKINRGICKRPTMTMPYGATQYGYTDQIQAAAKKEGVDLGTREEAFASSLYLAGVVYRALGEVVVKARAAMDWLQEAARIAASQEQAVRWRTPMGLDVVQRYMVPKTSRMDFEVLGRRFQFFIQEDGVKLAKKKQASGIAPNYVHSLDAAHLMATVNACAPLGITDFAMVHDSYGCHAADMESMMGVLRDCFVFQYRGAVLEEFGSQLREQLPAKVAAKVPPLPERGSLDLDGVLESYYFFA